MCGFSYNVGICIPIEAKLLGALNGLSLAWGMGYRKVCLKLDSDMVVQWLKADDLHRLALANLIEKCRQFLKRD